MEVCLFLEIQKEMAFPSKAWPSSTEVNLLVVNSNCLFSFEAIRHRLVFTIHWMLPCSSASPQVCRHSTNLRRSSWWVHIRSHSNYRSPSALPLQSSSVPWQVLLDNDCEAVRRAMALTLLPGNLTNWSNKWVSTDSVLLFWCFSFFRSLFMTTNLDVPPR